MSFLLDWYLLSLIVDGLPANGSVNVYLCADEMPTSENSFEVMNHVHWHRDSACAGGVYHLPIWHPAFVIDRH
jgi:hypothetical protein